MGGSEWPTWDCQVPNMRPTDSPAESHGGTPRPWWNEVLRAMREARGVTQAGWAALLGVSRRTVLRWEAGQRVPDTGAEAGLLAYCRERGLLRAYERGPLAGVTLSAELLQELLAEARWRSGRGRERATLASAGSSHGTPPATAAQPTGFAVHRWRQPPLVGRRRELALLIDRLSKAALGISGVVLLRGEPGVGKTRLLTEIAERASASGWQALVGAAFASEGMPPYLPFLEALHDYVRACPVNDLRQQLERREQTRLSHGASPKPVWIRPRRWPALTSPPSPSSIVAVSPISRLPRSSRAPRTSSWPVRVASAMMRTCRGSGGR